MTWCTLLMLGIIGGVATPGVSAAPIVAGPLTINLHVSETATVFHIVDQLAAWSPYCHAQYAAHFTELTDSQRSLLAEHAVLRQQLPWGAGLEQTFYTIAPLAEALDQGVRAGQLSEAQAERERRVLQAFVPLAGDLLRDRHDTLMEFARTVHAEMDALAALAVKAGRLCQVSSLEAPVYLIPNPNDDSFGGGFNGGRLTVEVSRHPELFNLFLHEVMHAFLRARHDRIVAAADECENLSVETLSEGIAYALSPGLLHNQEPDADPLRDRVVSDWMAGKPLSEPYTRFHRYALALRPLLDEAMEDDAATLEAFLPRAVDAWRVVESLSQALEPDEGTWIGKKSTDRSILMLMPHACHDLFTVITDRLGPSSANIWGRDHRAEHYDELYTLHAKPNDHVLLLFALDQPDRLPDRLTFLLPQSWSELETAARRDGVVSASHMVEGMEVSVLVATTCDQLRERLIAVPLD